MGAWIWGAVFFAIALVVAGGVAWWLAHGCVVTRVGAAGAVLGGLASLMSLLLLIDPDAAFRASATVTILSGAWLLAWALAGGIRGQLIDQRARSEQAARLVPAHHAATATETLSLRAGASQAEIPRGAGADSNRQRGILR